METYVEQKNTLFEKKEYKHGVMCYIFNKVIIAIDTTGKNYKELPEIIFGTFDSVEDLDLNNGRNVLNQPHDKMENIDMKYITECIKQVVGDSGINEFWFYPYGDDSTDKDRREQARLRLFRKYVDIISAPNDFGYIMKFN